MELADNVIWLDDLLILIQIKERNHNDAKTDQWTWFQNKVLKKAKNQIKKSLKFLENEQNILITNPLGQTLELKTDDIKRIHNLIIYHLNDIPTVGVAATKMYQCSDGKFIHVINSRDYRYLCHYLITPADMDAYLTFRERFLSSAGDVYVPEQYIFVHYFENPDDLIIRPKLLASLDKICVKVEKMRDEVCMYSFINRINSTLKVDNPNYRVIVRELAKMNSRELGCFRERFMKLLNSEPPKYPLCLLRFASLRTGCGYVLIKLQRDQEVHWENVLMNLTEEFKYKYRLGRCLGVIIRHPDDESMIDIDWAYIEGDWSFDSFLESLSDEPF